MKKILPKFIVLAAVLFAGTLFSCASSQAMAKRSPQKMLEWTLADQPDGIITIAQIDGAGERIDVYGNNGSPLPTKENLDHVFEVGSITKTITAALICRAVKEGLVGLDDSVDKILALPKREEGPYPSVRAFVTHSSGYPIYPREGELLKNHFFKNGDYEKLSKKDILEILATSTVQKQNKTFLYSNFGYAVLGVLLEELYKKPYHELANNFVQNELGMKHTYLGGTSPAQSGGKRDLGNYWDWKSDDTYLSAGGFYSTVGDMIIYARLQLEEKGIFADCHKVLERDANKKGSLAICYGWFFSEKRNVWGHSGATGHYNSFLYFDIKRQRAVIALSNLPPDFKIPASSIGKKIFDKNGDEK